MSSLILLSSRDATSPGSTNEELTWTISLPRLSLLNGFSLDLLSAEVPNAVYPINEYYNGISVQEDTGSALISTTVASSSYTGATLATAVAAALTAESAANGGSFTYSGSYDDNTKKITISSTDSFGWRAVANDMYEELGISTLDAAATVNSVVGDNPINISGSQYIDLISNFSTSNWSSSSSTKVFGRIQLAGAFGDVIAVNFPEAEPIYISSPDFNQFTLYLRDDRQNPWKLPGNMHLSLMMNLIPLENDSAAPGSANDPQQAQGYGNIGSSAQLTLPH